MKRIHKYFPVIILILIMSHSSCGNINREIIGEWKSISIENPSPFFKTALSTHEKGEILLTFFPDGTGYVNVIETEEKKSDVNIAVHMLHNAYKNLYYLAVLISNDSDLSEPLRIIKEELNKKIGIINPHKKPSRELGKYAIFQKQIRAGTLAMCQFPIQIQDKHGIINKPKKW